jgi:serine phosphatase RsbU (regulator of sigma subunit)/CHASE2 domain-containing sensor protein
MFAMPDFHLESVRRATRFGLVAALAAFLAALVVPHIGVFRKLELTTEDARLRLRGERPLDPAIALIEFDQQSLREYRNSWPIERNQYALLLAALREAGVKAVGIDLLFVGEDKYRPADRSLPTNDQLLAAVIARDPRIINGVYFPLREPDGELAPAESLSLDPMRSQWLRFTAPLPPGIELVRTVEIHFEMQEEIAESSAAVGHVSLYQDIDGVVRSVPLLVNHQGRAFPALGLLMAARYLEADWRDLRFEHGHAILPTPRGTLRVPVDAHARMPISFPGGRALFKAHPNRVEFVELLQGIVGTLPAQRESAHVEAMRRLEGSVALVCNTAATSAVTDFGPTPFDVNFPLAYVHASVVNSIFRGDYLQRVPRGLQIMFWAATAAILGVVLSVVAPIPFLVITLASILVYLVAGWASAAFGGQIVEIVPPVVMIGLMSIAIGARGYRLRDRQRRAQEQELAVARRIQQDLLPRGALALDGVEVMGFNLPCFAVGGDYFDYFPLADGRIALAIADVAGKGVPAALLMSNLQAILRAECARGSAVPAVPAQANRQLSESMGGNSKFVTFFYGAFDPRARRLSYSNAGHNPPLVVRADGRIEELETGGLLLGVFPLAEYDEGTVDLEPGDLCVLFTDGVTEAESKTRELYSDERLQGLLRQRRGESAVAIARAIADDVARFSHGLHQSDDVTVIVVKVADHPAPAA